MKVTGAGYSEDYPARNEIANLIGEFWDFDDDQLMKKHLPRLAALFLKE